VSSAHTPDQAACKKFAVHLPSTSGDDERVAAGRSERDRAKSNGKRALHQGAREPGGIVEHGLDARSQAGESVRVDDERDACTVIATQGHLGKPDRGSW